MKSIPLPGALWVALIVGIVPVVQQVISQFYPEASYPVTAVVVTGLGALAKGIQVATTKQPALPVSDTVPLPAATLGVLDRSDITAQSIAATPGWQRILFG